MLPLEMVHNGEGFVLMPLEERMALLDNALAKETPESLGAHLASFDFIEDKIEDGLPDICYKIADWWDGRKLQRRIVCAANRFELKDGGVLVIPGARHYSKDMAEVIDQVQDKIVSDPVHGDNQGFIDQWGEYWNRKDAFIIAYHAGQVNTIRKKGAPYDTLFSEDLY